MNVLGDLWNSVTSLFGGDKKKKEQAVAPRTSVAPNPQAQAAVQNAMRSPLATPVQQLSTPEATKPDNSINLFSISNQLKKPIGNQPHEPAPQIADPVTQKLDNYTAQYRQSGHDEGLSRALAAKQYQQEQGGGAPSDTVNRYINSATKISAAQGAATQGKAEADRNLWEGVGKIANNLGRIPVLSSLAKPATWYLGEQARNLAPHLAETGFVPQGVTNAVQGFGDSAQDISRRMALQMSDQEFKQLDPAMQQKLGILQGIDTAVAPLDLVAAIGLAKAPLWSVGKQAVGEAIKGGVSAESKQLLTQVAKEQALESLKGGVIGGVTGGGLSAGVQQWLGGKINPWDVGKSALTGFGLGLLNPSQSRAGAADDALDGGVASANPQANVAANSVDDVANSANDVVRPPAQPGAPGIARPAHQRILENMMNQGANGDQVRAYIATLPADQQPGALASMKSTIDILDMTKAPPSPNIVNNLPTDFSSTQLIMQDMLQKGASTQDIRNYINSLPEASRADALTSIGGVLNILDKPQTAAAPAVLPDTATNALNPVAREAEQSVPSPSALLEAQHPVRLPNTSAVEEVPVPKPVVEPPQAPKPVEVPPTQNLPEEPVTPPIQVQEPPTTDLPTPAQVAEQTRNPAANQVPAAPLSHDAVVKSLGDQFKDLKGTYNLRDSLNIQDTRDTAKRLLADIPDDSLLSMYQNADPETLITDARGLLAAEAALDRIGQINTPEAAQTVTNLLDAMDKVKSKSGQVQRVAQESFDKLPLPMKVRYLVKSIDRANKGQKNYVALADDPARASIIDAQISHHLRQGQNIANKAASVEGKLQEVVDAAMRGEKTTENIGQLQGQLKALQSDLAKQNGELVKYYQTLIPGPTKAQAALSDFPRTMMLASATGRVNDALTTANNVISLIPRNLLQGGIAKVINKVKPGLVSDTSQGMGRLFGGALEGGKQTVGEFRGSQYVPDLEQGIRGNINLRSGMRRPTNPVSRFVQTGVEAATNMSQGVKDQRLLQLADQEAVKAGLTGDLRTQYAQARSAIPTRQMLNQADELHKVVNNLNDNPVSRKLASISAGIGGDSAIGGAIKNQVLPFTSWLGGNIWNSVTDRNVIANTVKMVDAARKGDAEGVIRNLSAAGVGATEAYAIGYKLADMGVLSDTNAEGYNDGGLYLHIGDRYIGINTLGAFAPNIVLGNAAHAALNAPEGENPAVVLADKIGSYAWNGLALGSALGVENNLATAYDAASRPGGSPLDAAATLGAGAVGQYIPAITGDVNAVLDNYTSLNPTKERADTRVESNKILESGQKSTAKDYVQSAKAQVQNRIPVLSQELPRKTGVMAKDLIDRVVKGDRDTQTSVDARAASKAKVDQQKDFKDRDIPYYLNSGFEDAVNARVERGEYDKAIEALQTQVDAKRADKDMPASKVKDIENQITQLKITKNGNFKPDVIQKYKDTNLSEWRDMGDPDSDNYDPDTYQLLWDYDTALADSAVSRNTTNQGKNFYSAKTSKSGSGGSRAKGLAGGGNTVGTPGNLGTINIGDLGAKKAVAPPIPVLRKLRKADLPQRRKISVSR